MKVPRGVYGDGIKGRIAPLLAASAPNGHQKRHKLLSLECLARFFRVYIAAKSRYLLVTTAWTH
jgi:hypothetical protein